MRISIINGSPKLGESTSELLIKYLIPLIEENEVTVYKISKTNLTELQFENIKNSNVLIFVFPLYIDSIPANLLRLLIELEKIDFPNKNTMVYCIINNGFFEGKQNHIASSQIKNWCKIVGLTWGQTVGVGAGEMLPFIKDIPLGYGPNKNIGKAFKELARNIISLNGGKDLFVSPNWPRFLWKIQASLLVWYPYAKKNGIKRKRLRDKIQNRGLMN